MTDLLPFLRSRRSTRDFTPRAVPRPVLERLIEAATTAPSAGNRQPWRFAVVTGKGLRAEIAAAVRTRTAALLQIIRRGPHADDFGMYGDFFFEPLERAAAVIVPQARSLPDQLASFITSGGGDPAAVESPAAMRPEACATSAAVMALLLQAHSEGLGACWMAGPMVARSDIERLLAITPPWRMLGAVALGYPAVVPPPPGRRPAGQAAIFFTDPETP